MLFFSKVIGINPTICPDKIALLCLPQRIDFFYIILGFGKLSEIAF